MCGSGAMSCARNQPMATRMFSSSARMRSAHWACPSAGQSAFATSAPKCPACRRWTSARSSLSARRSAASSRTAASMWNLGPGSTASTVTRLCPASASSRSSVRSSVQTGDVHGGLDRPPVDEDRQRGQHPSLGFVEEPDAPLDGRPQRSLPFGEIDRAGAQGVEASFQPRQQGGWVQHPGASGGQLDGERETVDEPADLRDGDDVVVGQGEAVADRLRPIDEELHGRQRGQLVGGRRVRERGAR